MGFVQPAHPANKPWTRSIPPNGSSNMMTFQTVLRRSVDSVEIGFDFLLRRLGSPEKMTAKDGCVRSGSLMAQTPHEYHNKIHGTVETSCHLGHELHICTSNAYDGRRLNLRLNRIVPSKTGHTGYTRIGFFLSKNEARELRDFLSDVIEDRGAWDVLIHEPIRDMEDDS